MAKQPQTSLIIYSKALVTSACTGPHPFGASYLGLKIAWSAHSGQLRNGALSLGRLLLIVS